MSLKSGDLFPASALISSSVEPLNRPANQAGIPLELAGRLSGSTEEEIKADAENLVNFVGKKDPLPLRKTEPNVDDKDAGLKKMLGNLTNQK